MAIFNSYVSLPEGILNLRFKFMSQTWPNLPEIPGFDATTCNKNFHPPHPGTGTSRSGALRCCGAVGKPKFRDPDVMECHGVPAA